jgi:putative hydrolase of the HAD superfamily
MYQNIKVIAFDADDTLWVNETYFREAEEEFAKLLSKYETKNKIDQELFQKEIDNLVLYGYGIKGFILSMVESALEISNSQVKPKTIAAILEIGKDMLQKPIELVPNIELVLAELKSKYKLIVATKGDLLDQERKLEKSGLLQYFHHIEVMTDKKTEDYQRLVNHLDINSSQLLMIGNSLKSDVLPLLEIGAAAIHVPFHTTWAHEEIIENTNEIKKYRTIANIKEVLALL